MKSVIILIIIPVIAFAGTIYTGTISGELIYPGGGIGFYGVAVLSSKDILAMMSDPTDFDFFALPHTLLATPGNYTIEDTSIVDSIPYEILGVKSRGTSINYGDPMGMHPTTVFTVGGVAESIDVELDTIGTVSGSIFYPEGVFDKVKILVYTVNMMTYKLDVEGIFPVDSAKYTITLSSGFKVLVFFDDVNKNDVFDTLIEPAGVHTGVWGSMIFVGGGDRFAEGIDALILGSDVSEIESFLPEISLSCSPNPFNSITIINYSIPNDGILFVTDIKGKLIKSCCIKDTGSLKFGEGLSSGIYNVSISSAGNKKDIRLILLK
jgi:hypothetical protein